KTSIRTWAIIRAVATAPVPARRKVTHRASESNLFASLNGFSLLAEALRQPASCGGVVAGSAATYARRRRPALCRSRRAVRVQDLGLDPVDPSVEVKAQCAVPRLLVDLRP